jgi:hypothetical protein
VQKKKPALKEIDDLKDLLKSLFSSLEKEITKIDDQFNLVELDFMYGNIDENFYNEKMWQLSTEIYKVKQKLTNIQNLENRIH